MDEFSLAKALESERDFPLAARLTGARAVLRLLLWRIRTRLLGLAQAGLRLPASLRTRFLLFAALMVALGVVQGAVGWSVAQRSQAMSVTADQGVSLAMDDVALLRALKNMQVYALVTQNLVGTSAADDPVSARIDLNNVAKSYATALADLERLTTQRHMTRLGAITDVAHRIDVARDAFTDLHKTALQAVAEAAKDGKVPPALTLQVGARADGLFEQLDRMAEGVGLLARKDQEDLTGTLDGNAAVVKTFQWTMLAAGAIGLLACAVVTLFVLRGILRPLSSVAAATKNLAQGRIQATIPEFIATEIAAITRALAVFRANLMETDQLKIEQERQKERAEQEKRRMLHQLADSFEASIKGVVDEVTGAATSLRTTATSFSRAADEATSQALTVAGASELAAINVNTVAAAAEELSASIQEISRQVGSAADFANQAVTQAHQTDSVVRSLAQAVDRIGTVVDLISDIAHRTHMLALNATIEAARAGEYGKGFAVVACEVKVLSSQTADATAEVTTHIRSVQGATREAVAAIAAIGGTISQISSVSNSIAIAVEEQQAATAEISRSVQQAADGTREVSSNIAGVTRTAQEVGSGATELIDASSGLSHQSEALCAAVDTFLMGVREDGLTLEWSDDWLSGHPAIDAEHRVLVRCVNDLNEAMMEGRAQEVLARILGQLIDYVGQHFAHEEAIWAEGKLPTLAEHQQAHAALMAKVGRFRADFTAGNAELTNELMHFLRQWLVGHVFKVDKVAARMIREG